MIRRAQDQLGQPEERLAEKTAADPARDLIVFRRERGLAGVFGEGLDLALALFGADDLRAVPGVLQPLRQLFLDPSASS